MSETRPRVTAIYSGDGGGALFVGSAGGSVVEISATGSVARYSGDDGTSIRSLHATAEWLIAGGAGGRVRVWSRRNGRLVAEFAAAATVAQCAVLAPGVYVTVDVKLAGLFWQHSDETLEPTPIAASAGARCRFERFGIFDVEHLTLLNGFRWMLWERRRNEVVQQHAPVDGTRMLYVDGQTGLSPNGRIFYVYWDDALQFEVPSSALLRENPLLIPASASAVSDGGWLVLGGASGEVFVIDAYGRPIAEVHSGNGAVAEVHMEAGGAAAAFIDAGGRAAMITAEGGEEIVPAGAVDGALVS